MSKRKLKPAKPKSSGRILPSFTASEAVNLCAYLEASEKSRLAGNISAWSLQRTTDRYILAVVDMNSEEHSVAGFSIDDATRDLAHLLIALGSSAVLNPTPVKASPPRRLEKHEIPLRPSDRTEEDWDKLVYAAFALSGDLLTYLTECAVKRGIGVDAGAAALTIALGRLSGRYAFRTLSKEQVYEDVFSVDLGKPMFMLGFNEERRNES